MYAKVERDQVDQDYILHSKQPRWCHKQPYDII